MQASTAEKSAAAQRSSPSDSKEGLAGVGVPPHHENAGVHFLDLPHTSRTVLDISCDQRISKKPEIHSKNSRVEGVDVSHLKQKRLKTLSAASTTDVENERSRTCFCFESSQCVVRRIRAKRLKESSSVRRKLDFGSEEETSKFDNSANLENESFIKQWNFDFEKETPLPGSWIWTKVTQPIMQSTQDSEEYKSDSTRQKTLKDLFPVSKSRSQKRSTFRLPLAPIRTSETSPA